MEIPTTKVHGCPASKKCTTCEQARKDRASGAYVWIVCPAGNEVRTVPR